jgi:hypothetical protein
MVEVFLTAAFGWVFAAAWFSNQRLVLIVERLPSREVAFLFITSLDRKTQVRQKWPR